MARPLNIAWVLVSFRLVACVEHAELAVEPPKDVSWAALLELDDSGQVERGTRLVSWASDGALFTAAREGHEVLIIGYTEAQLAGYDQASFGQSTLGAAIGCEPHLPIPAWAARWTEDSVTELPSSEVPPVTADWARDHCPDLTGARVRVDLDCAKTACPLAVDQFEPCRLKIDLSGCNGLGLVSAAVDKEGQLCFETTTGRAGCRFEGKRAPTEHLSCTSPEACEIDFHLELTPAASPFTAVSGAFFGSKRSYGPVDLVAPHLFLPEHLRQGYAFDLVWSPASGSGGALLVSAADPPNNTCGTSTGTGRWIWLDPATLAPITSSLAPDCLERLVSIRGGQEILAAFVEQGSWTLGRFDPASSSLGAASTGLPANVYRLGALLSVGDRVIASFVSASGSRLISAAIESLRTERMIDLPGAALSIGVEAGDGEVLLADQHKKRLMFFDHVSLESRQVLDLPIDDPIWQSIFDLSFDASSGTSHAAAVRDAAVFVASREGVVRRAVPFWEPVLPSLIRPWSSGKMFVISLLVEGTELSAAASLLDLSTQRFLPGSWRLGSGPPARQVSDPTGQIYVLLPWSAEVIRIAPR